MIAETRNAQTAPVVVVALALCLLGVWLAAEPALAQEVVEKPMWSVGDWWEIGRYRFTVSTRNEDTYEMIRTTKGRDANLAAAAQYKVVVDIARNTISRDPLTRVSAPNHFAAVVNQAPKGTVNSRQIPVPDPAAMTRHISPP